ncbi:hypothetical protein AB0M83_38390 [Amycolatopsis sp. NPDC051106]
MRRSGWSVSREREPGGSPGGLNTASGIEVQLWQCNTTDAQKWLVGFA